MFPDPKYPPGTRLSTTSGQYGEVFGDTTRDILTVKMDSGGVRWVNHSELSTLEDYLDTTMPAIEGVHLPPLPAETSAASVHAFLVEHRPAADPNNPAARGREHVARQLRSALVSNESDTARISAGELPENPAAQPLTGRRSRQLARHFVDQARYYGDELRQHQLDTAPKYYVPGVPRRIDDREMELTAARDTAAEAAVRFTAGIDSLTSDQQDVFTERAVTLLGDFVTKSADLPDVVWNEAEWEPAVSS